MDFDPAFCVGVVVCVCVGVVTSAEGLEPSTMNILQQIIELGSESHEASMVAMAPGTVTVVEQVNNNCPVLLVSHHSLSKPTLAMLPLVYKINGLRHKSLCT